MKTELHHLRELAHPQRQEAAMWVSEQSERLEANGERIVPVTPEEVGHKYIGLLAMQNDALVGFVGAHPPLTGEAERLFVQVSSLIVSEQHQGYGIGHWLVSRITREILQGQGVPFAFCSLQGKSVFVGAGYHEATAAMLPPGITSPYGNQPMILN